MEKLRELKEFVELIFEEIFKTLKNLDCELDSFNSDIAEMERKTIKIVKRMNQ